MADKPGLARPPSGPLDSGGFEMVAVDWQVGSKTRSVAAGLRGDLVNFGRIRQAAPRQQPADPRRFSRAAVYAGALAVLLAAATGRSYAGVVVFSDRDEWLNAVGPVTTITFTEFPNNTFITDQYANLGVLFLDGNDNIACCNDVTFPNDGSGLDGNLAIHLAFLEPQAYIALDFPGYVSIQLFSDGQLIYDSPNFGGGPAFVGWLSTGLFDEAIIVDPFDTNVDLDDLHFGVPSPSAISLFLLGGAVWPRRRRRRRSRVKDLSA